MTKQTYFQLTEQGLRPVFHGTEEEFNDDIIKQSNLAKSQAEEHIILLKEELSKIEVSKSIEDMSFQEIERYKIDYFDKLFTIKNVEQKLLEHKEQSIDDGIYFTMDSVGKEFKFED